MAVYGPPGNEELYHWKYIRKYKKNGKWRYVYPNDKLGLKEAISTKITGSAYKQHSEELQEAKKNIASAIDKSTDQEARLAFEKIYRSNVESSKEFVKRYQTKSLSGLLSLSAGDLISYGKDYLKSKKK